MNTYKGQKGKGIISKIFRKFNIVYWFLRLFILFSLFLGFCGFYGFWGFSGLVLWILKYEGFFRALGISIYFLVN
jgi:hypothetical protein